mmetsp:Transcript_60561/g.141034  ORF Transcript_60561/g.141034 Transcript_60561/m.141034 type:complete len:247 (+) Transcript_60561:425-1165(+)
MHGSRVSSSSPRPTVSCTGGGWWVKQTCCSWRSPTGRCTTARTTRPLWMTGPVPSAHTSSTSKESGRTSLQTNCSSSTCPTGGSLCAASWVCKSPTGLSPIRGSHRLPPSMALDNSSSLPGRRRALSAVLHAADALCTTVDIHVVALHALHRQHAVGCCASSVCPRRARCSPTSESTHARYRQLSAWIDSISQTRFERPCGLKCISGGRNSRKQESHPKSHEGTQCEMSDVAQKLWRRFTFRSAHC